MHWIGLLLLFYDLHVHLQRKEKPNATYIHGPDSPPPTLSKEGGGGGGWMLLTAARSNLHCNSMIDPCPDHPLLFLLLLIILHLTYAVISNNLHNDSLIGPSDLPLLFLLLLTICHLTYFVLLVLPNLPALTGLNIARRILRGMGGKASHPPGACWVARGPKAVHLDCPHPYIF